MKWLCYFGFIVLLSAALTGCSAKSTVQPAVSVAGSARLYVEPDEAGIVFTLYSKEKVLNDAKQKNDALLQRLQAILKDFSIEQNNFALHHSTVEPEYRYDRQTDKRIFDGHSIRQTIWVKITDISRYESFVTALLNAGIDRIDHTEFSNSQAAAHREKARTKAVQAAIQKASALCAAAAGHKPVTLGRVLEIREVNINSGRAVPRSKMTNFERAATGAALGIESEGVAPIGTIPVEAVVEMVFAVE